MNKAQYEAAVAIINADCEGTDYLFYEGKTCVVGALLRAAGVSTESLDRRTEPTIYQYDILNYVYGLDGIDLDSLMGDNDDVDDVEERRIRVGATLARIYHGD